MTCSLTSLLLFHSFAGVPEPTCRMVITTNGDTWRSLLLCSRSIGTGGLHGDASTTIVASVSHSNMVRQLLFILASTPRSGICAIYPPGFACGFRIGFNRAVVQLQSSSINHPSTRASPGVVESNIRAEVEAGRLVGPLSLSWRQVLQCSPLGLVPKAQPGWFRTIVDHSLPRDHSVNSGISEEICSVSYATLDDAVDLIKWLGLHDTAGKKMDLEDVYRMVPMHPHD